MRRIREITSARKNWEKQMTWQDAEQQIRDAFQDDAYLYLEMDDKVLLGRYEEGKFLLHDNPFDSDDSFAHINMRQNSSGSSEEWSSRSLDRLCHSIQRCILFCEEQELRLLCTGELFLGRLRRDYPCENSIFVTDEEQKIWGSIRQVKGRWNQLKSQRGSSIWVPAGQKNGKIGQMGENMGIQVRRYYEFPDAAAGRGLTVQVDERMVGIVTWPFAEGSV